MKFIGVDGCRSGWVASITDGRSSWEIDVFDSIRSFWAQHKNASLILDAIVLALTAGIQGELTRIPAGREKDEKGLVMEIVYKRRNADASP